MLGCMVSQEPDCLARSRRRVVTGPLFCEMESKIEFSFALVRLRCSFVAARTDCWCAVMSSGVLWRSDEIRTSQAAMDVLCAGVVIVVGSCTAIPAFRTLLESKVRRLSSIDGSSKSAGKNFVRMTVSIGVMSCEMFGVVLAKWIHSAWRLVTKA